MSLDVGTLSGILELDDRPFEQTLRGVDAKANDLGNRVAGLGTKLTAGLTVPIAAGFAYATNAASDLAESVNVTGLIFDKSRDKIDAFVDNAAEGLGQSERAAREATATFGGLLQNLGLSEEASADWSMTLTTLASDLGSAFNREPAVAVEAIGAALRGETEPIRQFNVQLDAASVASKAVEMGLASSTAEVGNAARAQASLALIMEQTSAVQGDFANTSDGVANQTRILKARLEDTAATLGERLLPIATQIAGGMGTVLDVFDALPGPVQTGVVALLGVAAATGPVLTVAGNLSKLASGAADLASKVPGVDRFSGSLSGLAKAGAAVGAAFVAVQAVDQWAKSTADNVPSVDKLTASLIEFQETGRATGELASIVGDSFERLGHKIEIAGNSPFSIFDSAGIREVQEANQQLDSLDKSLANLVASGNADLAAEQFALITAKAGEQGVSVEMVNDRFNDYTDSLARAGNEQALASESTGALDGATESLGETVGTSASAVRSLEDRLQSLTDAYERTIGMNLTAEEATLRLRDDITALTESLDTNGATLDLNTEKGRANRQAVLDVTESVFASAQAYAEQTGDIDGARQQVAMHTLALAEQLRQAGLTEAEVAAYIRTLGLTPENITTIFGVDLVAAGAAVRAYQAELLRVPREIETRFRATGFGVADIGAIAGRAAGGPVKALTPYIVGEEGPELFVPRHDGTIVPNHALGAGSGSPGSPQFEVRVYVGGEELTEQLTVKVIERTGLDGLLQEALVA